MNMRLKTEPLNGNNIIGEWPRAHLRVSVQIYMN